MKKAQVFNHSTLAGLIWYDHDGYHFQYNPDYVQDKSSHAISLTLAKKSEAYFSKVMFPFFDGLIPEGWLLNLSVQHWKIDINNRMDLLLTLCEDCIGSVSIKRIASDE